jgi:hypothetical protein
VSLANLHTALTTKALSTIGSIPVARQNYKFAKPTDSKWAAYYFMPNVPVGRTLGAKGYDFASGIIQVDFHYPDNTGDGAADTDTETFRAAFKAGFSATYGGQSVTFTDCGAPHRRNEDNWFIVSVTVGWYALVPRS